MPKRRITKIEVETRELLIVRRHEAQDRPSCQQCPDGGTMLTPEEAAALTGISQRMLFRWLEQGLVHFCEPTESRLYLCVTSLPLARGKALTY